MLIKYELIMSVTCTRSLSTMSVTSGGGGGSPNFCPYTSTLPFSSCFTKSIVVAVIPTGCTMYLQSLDISIFSIFKNHYTDAAEEYLEQNGPRNKIKLWASQSRILCTRLTMTAWKRTINTINFKEEFKHIGYIWNDNSSISPRTLPGYTFDPSTINLPLLQINEGDDEENE